MTMSEQLLILFVMIAVPLTFIGVPLFVFTGGVQKFALKPLQKRFVGLDLHDARQTGDVHVVYHTYRGFLVWFVQDEHHVYATAEDARLILSRLLRFNLTWGMLSYGFLFVPILAIANYSAEKRSIERQQRNLAAAKDLAPKQQVAASEP